MGDASKEHNWEHRGIAPPYGNGRKWEPWIRFVFSFLFGAISTAFLLGGKSRDLGELIGWRTEYVKQVDGRFDNIWREFKRMDSDGTNKSKQTDQYQSEQIGANLTRIIEVERKSEQISVMQGKIERLESEVKILEERDKK